MIDIHCHIIPGVDDGAKTIEDAVNMAREAVADGIHTVIATPHHANGIYMNEPNKLQKQLERLKFELRLQEIPLEVKLGQEVHVGNQVMNELFSDNLLTLNESSHILIELPSSKIPSQLIEFAHELRLRNLIPIIAHPERNQEIANHPDILLELVDGGMLSQLTAQSVTGGFGSKLQRISLDLCRRNLVHFIASDAHNVTTRPFRLKDAYDHIGQILGQNYVNYFQNNAQSILDNHVVQVWEPQASRKQWWALWK